MSATEPKALASGRPQLHLTGFMGSGKSTIGSLLARRLVWNFLDLDRIIERHDGRPVAEIFANDGEGYFRRVERDVLTRVAGKPSTVVALGGGTLLDRTNLEVSKASSTLVWLRCPLDVLEARCRGAEHGRPLWGDRAVLEERYEARCAGYRAADYTVDAVASPKAVTEAIYRLVAAAAIDQ